MGKLLFAVVMLFSIIIYSQDTEYTAERNNQYYEDQFYLGVTYNFLGNTPEGLSQQNFSYGIQLGAIKDMPLNKKGTKAIGLGLGIALDNYYTNLVAENSNLGTTYRLANDISDFNRSKLETHLLEMPIEFRWRNSSAEEYRFWRFYAGVKVSYVLGARSKSVIGNNKNGFSNKDIQRLQYGPILNLGYNTFNVQFYYALSNLFEDTALLNNERLDFNSWKIGVIFYIL